jgi:hypothetical protein
MGTGSFMVLVLAHTKDTLHQWHPAMRVYTLVLSGKVCHWVLLAIKKQDLLRLKCKACFCFELALHLNGVKLELSVAPHSQPDSGPAIAHYTSQDTEVLCHSESN